MQKVRLTSFHFITVFSHFYLEEALAHCSGAWQAWRILSMAFNRQRQMAALVVIWGPASSTVRMSLEHWNTLLSVPTAHITAGRDASAHGCEGKRDRGTSTKTVIPF